MSNVADHLAGAAEFKQALIAGVGSTLSPHRVQGPWDPALLRRVEAVLARHVGPIAAVLVRRSVPDCHDLTTLCERLAEQVTLPRSAPRGTAPAGAGPGMIPDSLVEASAGVLALSLGPIAAVLARRAAITSPDRAAYFAALAAAIADTEKRQAVRVHLDKLP
ncbi:MAG: hypothetical protein HZC37_02670 [Burkholderiales bacterium]|nr:hypothetical protein [Burkholderiales bacterium]